MVSMVRYRQDFVTAFARRVGLPHLFPSPHYPQLNEHYSLPSRNCQGRSLNGSPAESEIVDTFCPATHTVSVEEAAGTSSCTSPQFLRNPCSQHPIYALRRIPSLRPSLGLFRPSLAGTPSLPPPLRTQRLQIRSTSCFFSSGRDPRQNPGFGAFTAPRRRSRPGGFEQTRRNRRAGVGKGPFS